MKKLIIAAFFLSICYSCNQNPHEAHQVDNGSVENVAEGKVYGATFTPENMLTTAQLTEALQGKDSVQAVIKAEITSSCQSKGCWMDVKLANDSTMKVTFKDYGFFLPVEDLTGKTVVFKGTARREITSVDDLRHYAQDAGNSQQEIDAITKPKEEIRFEADGVILQ